MNKEEYNMVNREEYNKLDKKEKNDFLANDLIDRVVKVEQRISSKFGKLIHYSHTEIYKSLNSKQKISYEKYLKNKKRNKLIVYTFFLVPIVLISLINVSFTGNVVNDSLTEYGFLDYLLLIVIVFCIVGVYCIYYFKKKRNKKLDGYVGIIDNIFLKKVKKSI